MSRRRRWRARATKWRSLSSTSRSRWHVNSKSPLHVVSGESYRVVGGSTHAYVLGEVLVRVVAEDRYSDWVKARAVSVPGEHEVLLSDKLLDVLNIEIARAGLGYWRFNDEGPGRLRRSVEAQFWVE